jgi:hypothetical protein
LSVASVAAPLDRNVQYINSVVLLET